jgi:hypothetical protein
LFDENAGAPHDSGTAHGGQIKPHSGIGDSSANFDSRTAEANISGTAYNKHNARKLDDLDDLLED